MITQRQALDDFILNRVLGDEGFALGEDGYCTYSHKVNGGCAIGKWLREEDAEALAQENPSAMHEITQKAMERAGMEAPGSMFWSSLQCAHDYLATGNSEWEDDIRSAARSCL